MPTLEEAEKIREEALEYRKANDGCSRITGIDEIRVHTRMVAYFAKKLAKQMGLNEEKAYIFGILHDIGKRRSEFRSNKFHGQEGYDLMSSLGYDEVARICLTHSFIDKDFLDEDYVYSQEWKDWARSKLKDIEYDDYDRIIQFCDLLSVGFNLCSIEERVNNIVVTYNATEHMAAKKRKTAYELKDYLEKKCGRNIYQVLRLYFD
jgi:putative nucleotidyltransferase with HDIG domain